MGYDPACTQQDKIPIVAALIKVASDTKDHTPVLLKVHEAPYLPHSPVSLLSEYQIREYGLVIDSVAKKHHGPNNTFGTQSFQVNPWVSIHLQDQGGLMGFELLPIEDGDEDRYDIITITGPNPWNPNHFRGQHLQSQQHEPTLPFYDPADLFVELGEFHEDPPSTSGEEVFHDEPLASESQLLTSQMSYEELTGKHPVNPILYGYPAAPNGFPTMSPWDEQKLPQSLDILHPDTPLVDTHVYATRAWHRVIYNQINPQKL